MCFGGDTFSSHLPLSFGRDISRPYNFLAFLRFNKGFSVFSVSSVVQFLITDRGAGQGHRVDHPPQS
jgi:hypothetical protein